MIEPIILIIAAGLIGGLLGSFTGIVPGIHANTLALILLSVAVAAESYLDPYVANYLDTRLLLSVIIAATALAHTFANFIPGTFLGAPEAETALSILPMHNMLNNGHGYRAVVLSAIGSLYASIIGFMVLIPLQYLQETYGLYNLMSQLMFPILLFTAFFLIYTDRSEWRYRKCKMCFEHYHDANPDAKNVGSVSRWSGFLGSNNAIFVFAITGWFGYIVLNKYEGLTRSPVGLPSTALFPALTGIFGAATLLYSVESYTNQNDDNRKKQVTHEYNEEGIEIPIRPKPNVWQRVSAAMGSVAGVIVALLPGVTPGIGTIISMWIRQVFRDGIRLLASVLPIPYKETEDRMREQEEVIITLGSVNTAAVVIITGALFIILRPRNGTSIVINELISVSPWSSFWFPPVELLYLITGMLIAMVISFRITCVTAYYFANSFDKIPYVKAVMVLLVSLLLLVFLFTGIYGVMIFIVATAIGQLPIRWEVRRSVSMGVLLVPVMIFFLPEPIKALIQSLA